MSDQKRARTRNGCLNCRRKRRKCDEQRPTCAKCSRKNEACRWGTQLSFHAKNARTIAQDHPSMQSSERGKQLPNFQIINMTSEVIRDYWREPETEANGSPIQEEHYVVVRLSDTELDRESAPTDKASQGDLPPHVSASTCVMPLSGAHFHQPRLEVDVSSVRSTNLETHDLTNLDGISTESLGLSVFQGIEADADRVVPNWYTGAAPRSSYDLNASSSGHFMENTVSGPYQHTSPFVTSPKSARSMPNLGDDEDSPLADGIFLPGSVYRELHTTLRDHIFSTARSNAVTGQTSPINQDLSTTDENQADGAQTDYFPSMNRAVYDCNDRSNYRPLEIPNWEEYELWKNYTDEVAPWLDKFDLKHHFQCSLPILAKSNPHLRYSILALSARQIERRTLTQSSSRSLALYQEAIHQLLPELNTVNTAVIASCVVLCVLEMMSCAPKEWRRHLDGCASLIKSVGINGFSGGIDQALFWCFARMDVCGGLISSECTIIPIETWASRASLVSDVKLFQSSSGFDVYACYAVYICGQVLDFLAGSHLTAEFPTSPFQAPSDVEKYNKRWKELFTQVIEWYDKRPSELKPVFQSSADQSEKCPFPMLLFGNAPAISGNQLFHTAAILMLQHCPKHKRVKRELPPESIGKRSILWHARRVCAISIWNTHHGCWSNAVQPLWIAGKLMSHPAEHAAILELYERIEKETGWGTRWRADDLRDFWGNLDDL